MVGSWKQKILNWLLKEWKQGEKSGDASFIPGFDCWLELIEAWI